MENRKARRIPYYCTAALIFIILATVTFADIFGYRSEPDVVSMYDSWYLEGSDEPIQTVSMEKGQHYTFIAKVPDSDLFAPCLQMISDFCATKIYCDDREIYSYGTDYLEAGEVVPKAVLFVPVPASEEEQTLRLGLDASLDTTYTFSTFYYGTADHVTDFFLQERRLPIVTGLFLTFFGILLLLTLPVMLGQVKRDPSVFFHGFLLADLGVYFLLYNSLPQIYLPQYVERETLLEYLALYLIPIFLHGTMVFGEKKKHWVSDYALLVVDIALPVVALFLDLTGIRHIEEIVVFAHAIIFVQGAYCLRYLVITSRTMRRENVMYFDDSAFANLVVLVGLNCFVVFTYIDLISWYVLSPKLKARIVVKGPFLMVGAILVALCMILSYFFHRLAEVSEQENRENLEDLAFTDALTGLYNRTYCDQIMAKLTHEKEPGCIISLDLDRLKEVNDTRGHQAGDLFLQSFADVLKDTFRDAGIVGRMGGDEFLVIMDGDHAPHVRSYIISLERAMAFKNGVSALFTLSASWGIANTQDDGKGDYHATYLIADERMYRMKEKHHQGQDNKEVKE